MRVISRQPSRRSRTRLFLRVGVLVAAVGVSLLLASSAFATSYWFYQGNLPTSGGARTVLLGSNPPPAVYQRESWTSCTHDMYYVQVEYNGSWDLGTFFSRNGCDQEIMVQYPDLHNNYGCENPPGDSTVYVNCRAGTGR
jgi:hypothetical protein